MPLLLDWLVTCALSIREAAAMTIVNMRFFMVFSSFDWFFRDLKSPAMYEYHRNACGIRHKE